MQNLTKCILRFIAKDVSATLKSSRQNYLDVGVSILLIQKYKLSPEWEGEPFSCRVFCLLNRKQFLWHQQHLCRVALCSSGQPSQHISCWLLLAFKPHSKRFHCCKIRSKINSYRNIKIAKYTGFANWNPREGSHFKDIFNF